MAGGDRERRSAIQNAETLPLSSGDSESTPPVFQPGELIAARYLVARFVAQGGMGQVYVARDVELGATVALKTLRPELHDAASITAFKQEMLLSRRVTHQNVCRLFDVGYHDLSDGRQVVFLTMELLDGETLAAYLTERGPLGARAALELLRPLVAGLAAAHEAGVVHRDFKAENVVIVPGEARARVVVTDFGMAALLQGGQRHGPVVGSASTISPEQIEGGSVDARADVYALGVVMFQMRTGRLPFTGDTPLAAAMARLSTPPPSPGLGEPWDGAILRCLAREPERRFASVTDALSAVEPRRRTGGRLRVALAVAGALILGAGAIFVLDGRGASSHQASPAARRSAVAVIGFADLSVRGDTAWVGTALGEMTAAELVAGGQLRVIGAETVARARADFELPAGSVPNAARDLVRAAIGADYFIGGSYLVSDGRLRVDAVLVDARSGETIDATSADGTVDELSPLVTRVSAGLRTALGVRPADDAATHVAASMPHDAQAARHYSEGIAALRVYDLAAAQGHLEAAVAREPGHALSWMALADVRQHLQDTEGAEVAARRAWEGAAGLPREDRLAVEARHLSLERQPERAAELYGALYRFFPDDLEHGLRFAAAQVGARRYEQAITTIAELRRLPAPSRDDPRIDLVEASASAATFDFASARTAAARAAAQAEKRGARHLLAEARRVEGWAARNLGDLDGAEQAAGEARTLFAVAGNRGGEAACLETLGEVYAKRGQLRRLEEVAAERARIWKDLGNTKLDLMAQLSAAGARAMRGEAVEARQSVVAIVEGFRGIGNIYGEAVALIQLADIERSVGELEAASGHAQDALRITATQTNRRLQAFAETVAGDVALARGDLREARRMLEIALATREDLKLELVAAQTRLVLARLELIEGRVDVALALAQDALRDMAPQGAADDEASAMAVVARALARQGKLAEARQFIARARERTAGSENVDTRRELDEAEREIARAR